MLGKRSLPTTRQSQNLAPQNLETTHPWKHIKSQELLTTARSSTVPVSPWMGTSASFTVASMRPSWPIFLYLNKTSFCSYSDLFLKFLLHKSRAWSLPDTQKVQTVLGQGQPSARSWSSYSETSANDVEVGVFLHHRATCTLAGPPTIQLSSATICLEKMSDSRFHR